ncbi:unnamed protein product [Ectocarpus sp. 6 AP-2014]
MSSRGHQQILPKSSSRSRKGRGHRRSRSVESGSSTGSKPSPVVITTVHGRKDKKSGGTAGGTSTSSAASADSSFKAGGGDRSSLRTVSQQRPRGSSSEKSSSAAGGGGGGGGDTVPPKLTIDAADFAVRVPVKGTSVRSELSRGLSPAGSQASSVVTRVYAPSSVGGGDQAVSLVSFSCCCCRRRVCFFIVVVVGGESVVGVAVLEVSLSCCWCGRWVCLLLLLLLHVSRCRYLCSCWRRLCLFLVAGVAGENLLLVFVCV